MDDRSITIRAAETVADYRACQVAQRLAWGITDDSYLIPLATMVGAQHHGGLVLGAFRTDGEAVGLSFAFLGRVGDRPCLYSQLTGVIPGHQGSGIGGRLKGAQRDFARISGLPCLAWSFDPFRIGNARFNLARLGARARRYIPDMYGPRSDALNLDAPTDRLIVEWETEPVAPPTYRLDEVIGRPGPEGGAPRSAIEIPVDLAGLRVADPDRAAARLAEVRRRFVGAFEAGYRADGFVSGPVDGVERAFYALSRD